MSENLNDVSRRQILTSLNEVREMSMMQVIGWCGIFNISTELSNQNMRDYLITHMIRNNAAFEMVITGYGD